MARAHVSPMLPSLPYKKLFPLSVFARWKYAYGTRQGILAKIGACEQLQEFCEYEQVSTRLIFALALIHIRSCHLMQNNVNSHTGSRTPAALVKIRNPNR